MLLGNPVPEDIPMTVLLLLLLRCWPNSLESALLCRLLQSRLRREEWHCSRLYRLRWRQSWLHVESSLLSEVEAWRLASPTRFDRLVDEIRCLLGC